MVSLYFHLPFCTKKCPYCHFFVIPNNNDQKKALHDGLLKEWKREFSKIAGQEIVSIYFGGGTPSLFDPEYIESLLSQIAQDAQVASDCEITLEANPEDVSLSLMQRYKKAGINRVSIGVQSLDDQLLTLLERTHNSNKAVIAINETALAGISNISIDLMTELPTQNVDCFQRTLDQLRELPITHLSLYNLTIEPHTSFYKRQKQITPLLPSPEDALHMLESAVSHLEQISLYRYEISAFAKKGYESRHNSGYWTARPFLGLGPSAFSYFGGKRYRNMAHFHRYLEAVNNGLSPVDFEEQLPYPENVLELLAVELRLVRGVEIEKFSLPEKTYTAIEKLIHEGYLQKEKRLQLTERGRLFYDFVASEII